MRATRVFSRTLSFTALMVRSRAVFQLELVKVRDVTAPPGRSSSAENGRPAASAGWT